MDTLRAKVLGVRIRFISSIDNARESSIFRILLGKKMLILTMRVPEGIFVERIQHNVLNIRQKYKTEIHVDHLL